MKLYGEHDESFTYKKQLVLRFVFATDIFIVQSFSLKKAFFALTPGRQKGYVLHFSEAKQSKTRLSRIEKCINLILQGKGLNDEYIRSKNKLKD